MDDLKQRLLKEAEVAEGDMIRVDMFLNHQLDIDLLERIGKELARRFKGTKVDKVLTAESSGIPIAIFVAKALKVPVVYAKKFQSGFQDPDVYSAETHSFSMEKTYTLRVARRYLHPEERVLLVDDILSNGQAMLALLELAATAGAQAVGVGVAIEKNSRDGGRVLRRMGFQVESIVAIDRVEDGHIILAED